MNPSCRPRFSFLGRSLVALGLLSGGSYSLAQTPQCPLTPTSGLPALTAVPGTGTGSGALPLILVHGNHGEEDRACGNWTSFISAALQDPAFAARYKLYVFVHDTTASIGFDGASGNALDLGHVIDREFAPSQLLGIIAHSRGGLVARAYMNRYGNQRHGDRVFTLLTLGTPHHGTPPAVADWGLKTLSDYWADGVCYVNYVYNVTNSSTFICNYPVPTGPDTFEEKSFNAVPIFNVTRSGSNELRWDNFDGPEFGIEYIPTFVAVQGYLSSPIAVGNTHTLSLLDGNTGAISLPPGQSDTDLHGPQPNPNPHPSLQELNQSEKYINTIIAYGGYYTDPRRNATLLDAISSPNDEHKGLSYAGGIMAKFHSANEAVGLFNANDGLVPLQSASFSKMKYSLLRTTRRTTWPRLIRALVMAR